MKKAMLCATALLFSSSPFAAGIYDGIWLESSNGNIYHSIHTANNQLIDIQVEPNNGSYVGSWASTLVFTMTGPNTAALVPTSKIGGTESCRPTGTLTFNAEGTKATLAITAVDPVPGSVCDMKAGSSITWSKVL